MRTFLALTLVWLLLASNAVAQFTGSTTTGRTSKVEQARNARVDTYVTVTGNIVAYLREDYYTFRDDIGDIRVEISPESGEIVKLDPTRHHCSTIG